MREILFRGKRVDNGEWVEGNLVKTKYNSYIVPFYDEFTFAPSFKSVLPETVGQFRYENQYGKYFDGDIYLCAGYGNDVVSELCEIQDRLMHGETDDVLGIIGNIHDNPELLTEL